MSVESFNTIELRYADSELAKHRFVKLEDYRKQADFNLHVARKMTDLCYDKGRLEDSVELLIAERNYWHNMYNAASAPVNESGLVNEMLEQ